MTKIRVAGIIIEDSKVLTTKMEKNGEEYHVLPGGRVEKDENIEAALKRELEEETSIEANKFSLAYIRELDLEKERRGIEFYYHITSFQGKPETGFDPEDKDSELKNVDMIELDNLDEKTFFPQQLVEKLSKDEKQGFQKVRHLGLHSY